MVDAFASGLIQDFGLRDPDDLRKALEDYYGTAVASGLPAAMVDLAEVEDMSDDELRERVQELGL